MALLSKDDPPVVGCFTSTTRPEILIVCDHAGVAIPKKLGRLGLPDDLNLADQHIAVDIGAKQLALKVAKILGANLLWQNYSRLVVDCNRPPESSQSICSESDGIPIPGNHEISKDEIRERIEEIFLPYDNQCFQAVSNDDLKLIISMHSFTPTMQGFERPWNISFLFNKGEVYAKKMASFISACEPDLNIGFNEPYQVDKLSDWFVIKYAEPKMIPQVLIEVRNDHLRDRANIDEWALRISEASIKMLEVKEW
ncbi:MAG: N-formylglutamate amidohydrolase [Deltaproteobacteria bacterium]